jgi:hypothetical protein
VTPVEVLGELPLVTAGVWFTLAAFQVYRDRVHTWTESFFLAGCIFAGFYAVSDWIFFHAVSLPAAQLAATTSLSAVVLMGLFLFLFTLVYLGRMRSLYWIFPGITAVVIGLIWSPLAFPPTVYPPTSGGFYRPVFNQEVFGIITLLTAAFATGGSINLYRVHRIVRQYSQPLARRSFGLFIVFVVALVVGLSTNGYLGIAGRTDIPPPFSTLLGFVAGATLFTLYPGSGQRISVAIRRFQARRYSIKAAFVTYRDGTLIGSKVQAGESIIDRDLFGATLDVIQNFMRTSFPLLRGKSLRTIKHGDYSLIIERAEYAYLTVVLGGEESDQLRRQMRDLLLEFEASNRDVLARWKGIPEQALGIDKLLDAFFIVEEPLVQA